MKLPVSRPYLLRVANAFRSTIEAADRRGSCVLGEFPRGACGTVSDMIGLHLYERGLRNLWYVCGTRPDPARCRVPGDQDPTHAWVRVGRTIVDITADQFPDYDGPPVFVGPPSPWHLTWTQEKGMTRRMTSAEVSFFIDQQLIRDICQKVERTL